jgi:hypothetical protein
MTSLLAVLDTNLFLHYVPIDQIKWHDFLQANHIVLVITPTILRQLNDKKDSPGNRKMRERAAASLKRLDALADQPPPCILREGVEAQFVAHEPLLDFSSHNLSRHIGDDWLLAAALELRDTSESGQVVLVTQDLGLKIKARTHEIRSASVPETYKLPDDLDEDQKKIKELEAQIRQIKMQMPALSLIFEDGTNRLRQILQLPRKTPPDVVPRELAELRAKFPKLDSALEIGREALLHSPPLSAIHEYNKKLDSFYARFEKYIHERDEFPQTQARQIQFDIRLLNTGNTPAEDIDILMHFPDGFTMFEDKEELPLPPSEPLPPGQPLSPLQETLKGLQGFSVSQALAAQLNPLTNFDFTPPVGPRNVSRPKIRKTNSYDVESHVEELKHNFTANLGRFFIGFDSWKSARSFSIDYDLYASNLPDKVEGKLHVIVEIGDELP